ncbi:MAG: hypothetical protein M1831_000271 [Alyxoria varia]|nr:MAG: hypothetical protein M1831_000271 [Alyxoria varia]
MTPSTTILTATTATADNGSVAQSGRSAISISSISTAATTSASTASTTARPFTTFRIISTTTATATATSTVADFGFRAATGDDITDDPTYACSQEDPNGFGSEKDVTVSKVLRHKDKYLNPSNQPHNPSPSSPNAATASPRSPHHSLLHSSSGRKVSTSSGGGGSGSGSSKTSSRHHPDIDRTLAKWCSNQQAKGVTLTDELIRDQARLFLAASGAVDVFGSGGGDGGSGGRGGSGSGGGKSGSGSNFSAANSAASAAAYLEGDKWLDKFKLKHNISTPGTPTPDSATRRKASLAASTAHPSDKMDTSVVVDSSPSLQTPLSPRSATTTESTTLPTAGSMEGLGIRNAHPSTSTALDSPGSLFSPSTNAATMTNTSTAGAGSGAYISPPQSAEALSVTTPTSSSSSSRHGGGGGGGGSGGAQSTIFDRSAMPPPPTTSGVPSSTTRSGAPPIHWATGAPPPLSNPYALADPPQTNMSSLFSSDWSGSSHFENSEKRTGSISAQDAQRCLETALAFLEQEVPTPDNGEQGWGRDVTDVRRVMGRLRMGSLQADSGGGFGVGGYAGEEEEVGDEMMGRIDEGGE